MTGAEWMETRFGSGAAGQLARGSYTLYAVLTITGNYHILIARENLTTMRDEFTTPQGTASGRHWAVDYRLITQRTS